MSSVRAFAKRIAEAVLGAPALMRLRHRSWRGRRLVLSYHNVIAGPATLAQGDRSLHLPFDAFRSQLDALEAAALPVVPLDVPLEPEAGPCVVITFDDAYAGVLEFALPELERRQLPATIVVAPGMLGLDAPWWDRLADPILGAVPQAYRDRALGDLGGDGERILRDASAGGHAVFSPMPEHRIATECELSRAIAAHPLVMLGSHTWSHANVAVLDAERMRREMRESLAWLKERFGSRTIDRLAYPYGFESPAARAAAAEAGYRGAFRVSGGWDLGGGDRFAAPRLNVTPGISPAGFRARLAGIR
jgi:peptidoglycan/xylan/chitin deacetylase (PgdA/CDA1 family)